MEIGFQLPGFIVSGGCNSHLIQIVLVRTAIGLHGFVVFFVFQLQMLVQGSFRTVRETYVNYENKFR